MAGGTISIAWPLEPQLMVASRLISLPAGNLAQLQDFQALPVSQLLSSRYLLMPWTRASDHRRRWRLGL